MAGQPRLALGFAVLETAVLLLHYSPVYIHFVFFEDGLGLLDLRAVDRLAHNVEADLGQDDPDPVQDDRMA